MTTKSLAEMLKSREINLGEINEILTLAHRDKVEKAITAAKPYIADFQSALAAAEVIYTPHIGKGKAYENQERWHVIQSHCGILRDLYCNPMTEEDQRRKILEVLLGKAGEGIIVKPSFIFDFGPNIFMKPKSFLNVNVTILDWARVIIGEGSKVAANSCIYTVGHTFSTRERLNYILGENEVVIGDYVWVGGGVLIRGGVKIGDGSIIGMGAVITKDVPAGTIVIGNNKIVREMTLEELTYEEGKVQAAIEADSYSAIGMGAVITKDVPTGTIVEETTRL